MKFDRLYALLEAEENASIKKHVQEVLGGVDPENHKDSQIDPTDADTSEYDLDLDKYAYVALFAKGDHYFMITMTRDGEAGISAGKKGGSSKKLDFSGDIDEARKHIRANYVPGLRIVNPIARLKGKKDE